MIERAFGGLTVAGVLLLSSCVTPASLSPAPTSTSAPPTSTSVPPTSTPEPDAPGPGSDPQGFAEFSVLLARAAQLQDTTFLAERVAGRPYTCTEGDVTGDGLGGAGPDLCKELGQELNLVLVSRWRSEGYNTWPEAISREIEDYFANALPLESDDFGTGAVQLYAIAESRWLRDERTRKVAIFTAITPAVMWPAPGDPTRTVRAIDFEYADERWEITGIMLADILAGELLTAGASPFVNWQRYLLGGV